MEWAVCDTGSYVSLLMMGTIVCNTKSHQVRQIFSLMTENSCWFYLSYSLPEKIILYTDPLLTYIPTPPTFYYIPQLQHFTISTAPKSSDFQRSKAPRIPFQAVPDSSMARTPTKKVSYEAFVRWKETKWSSTICPVAQNKVDKLTLQMQYLDPTV
jgi:hypothetical protein